MGQVLVHPVTTMSPPMGSATSLWPPRGTPAPMGPHRQRDTSRIPLTRTHRNKVNKFVGFAEATAPGTDHLSFHLHPKSHFNHTPGRVHSRELPSGAKSWWKKPL